MKTKKKAFTLVELLVVIAILAILATVSILGYTSFTKKAKESNAKSEMAQMYDYMLAQTLDGKSNFVVNAHKYTESEANTYNAKLTDALKKEVDLSAPQAAAYNATLPSAVKTGDKMTIDAYNKVVTDSGLSGTDQITLSDEQAKAYNAKLSGAVNSTKKQLTAVEANEYNKTLEGHVEADDYVTITFSYDSAQNKVSVRISDNYDGDIVTAIDLFKADLKTQSGNDLGFKDSASFEWNGTTLVYVYEAGVTVEWTKIK